MSNTITPTVFYRTPNVEALEIFYREAGPPHITERTDAMYKMKKLILCVFLLTFGLP